MMWIWLGIVVTLILIEAATVNLVTVWFIVSGLLAMFVSLFISNFFIQFLVFVLVGIILLFTTRDYLLKLISKGPERTNLDRVIGMIGIVTQEINKNKSGEVKVDGKRWTAISNNKIKIDSTVKVLEIDGVKLKVEEVKD